MKNKIFQDESGNKLIVDSSHIYAINSKNQLVNKRGFNKVFTEYQKAKGYKRINLGKEISHGKKIDVGKQLDFGKKLDFGKDFDLGELNY